MALARLEDGHVRELRHDFRAVYGVAYDDVPTEEAVDLIATLPMGSRYAAAVDARAAWDEERHRLADVVDLLNVINWRLARCPGRAPARMDRPGDREAREDAARRAADVRRRIEETEWEEAD